jgi:hypothetical protein
MLQALGYNHFMDVIPLEWVERVHVQPTGFSFTMPECTLFKFTPVRL